MGWENKKKTVSNILISYIDYDTIHRNGPRLGQYGKQNGTRRCVHSYLFTSAAFSFFISFRNFQYHISISLIPASETGGVSTNTEKHKVHARISYTGSIFFWISYRKPRYHISNIPIPVSGMGGVSTDSESTRYVLVQTTSTSVPTVSDFFFF